MNANVHDLLEFLQIETNVQIPQTTKLPLTSSTRQTTKDSTITSDY